MYVCSCHALTHNHIEAEIAAGARCTREISAACRAGTDCGGCVRNISAILRAARQSENIELETAV
ncbi:(2Fe-2S)-binding protein [Rhodococcus sp. NPDC003382]|uniref:(2Fe-2S)-binding protein n=1 Tax=unclassified Rhodococcus (in: high G+C Gram-positive bacteria) TaxID=192944 RepID=UPI0018CE95B4|nr:MULTISPECIES: (2Fe-2S)-binding protein [unclassified Rhodococcus (in: high G+C Gram-positive bacteria)]MBH0119742.1 (2Fe-2S)-binding protein [Rhodococcus sp. CX]MCK8674763.1 (2Fe-2S)-binding protein [Rhodococcus sp. HM1]